jgi:hypothetical protein
LKPRLIKFSCPACNARLAVPDAMAGMEDNCPKCAARIKAPLPEAEPAPKADPAPALALEAAHSSSGRGILDAVLQAPEPAKRSPRAGKSKASTPTPKQERPSFSSTLFDEFLSTVPLPAKEIAPPPTPVEVPSEVPSEIPSEEPPKSERKVPAVEHVEQVPPPELPSERPPAAPPLPEPPSPAEIQAPAVLETIAPANPEPVNPAPEPAPELPAAEQIEEPTPDVAKPELGMGEMIAEQANPNPNSILPALTRHVLPSLGVGLMQVEDTPRNHRLRRRRRAIVTGILLFLLFDAAIVCWVFRHRIAEWWDERHPPILVRSATTPPSAATTTDTPSPRLAKADAVPVTGPTGEDLTASPGKPPALPPSKEPEKINPLPVDMPPAATAATTPGAVPGNDPSAGARNIGEMPGKKDSSAAQLASAVPPSPLDSEAPKAVPLPEPAPDPGPNPDVPAPAPSKPVEPSMPPIPPMPSATESLLAKTEITLPPLPPPLPPGAAIPGAPDKPAAPEPSPPATANAVTDVPSPAAKIVESNITAAARPALAALKNFLAAKTWEERLAWVQKPDTVKAAMEKHYATHPDGPVNVARIDLIERYPARSGNPPYAMFEVRGGDLKHSILVLVEEKSKTNIRVDWEAFVEFKDQLLWEFLIKPGSPPGKFRVMIRRQHYFDKDVPELDRKDAFLLSQPGADTTANAFAVKGAAAARSLSHQLGWGDSIAVMVQLVWHGEGDHGWVELKAVPAFGWRG